MADSQMTDEELELERQRELEEEEKNSDVDTSIPTGEEEAEEEGQDEESSADKDEEPEQEEPAPDGADEDEEPRQTRKERRADRAKRFAELRRDSSQREQQRQQLFNRPGYNPMDYNKSDEELTVEQLEKDRAQYGDSKFSEGARIERFYADQERYNDKVEADNDYILSRPEYSFLDEDNADGFDAELADDINNAHLMLAQYDEDKKVWGNTGVRYKDTVAMMVKFGEKYHQMKSTNSAANLKKQASSAGVRPTGGARESYRVFTPEQIARMTPAQAEKYSKDIDRQIEERLAKGI